MVGEQIQFPFNICVMLRKSLASFCFSKLRMILLFLLMATYEDDCAGWFL